MKPWSDHEVQQCIDERDSALRLASSYQTEMRAAFASRDAAEARIGAAEFERDKLREILARGTGKVGDVRCPEPTVYVGFGAAQARYLADHLDATCCGISYGFRRDLFHEASRLIKIACRQNERPLR